MLNMYVSIFKMILVSVYKKFFILVVMNIILESLGLYVGW